MGDLFFVGVSLVTPAIVLTLLLGRSTEEGYRSVAGGLLLLGVLAVAPFATGWVLHEASYSGHFLPYASITWTGTLWGGALVRLLDHKRLVNSQRLIDARLRKLEEAEEQIRQGRLYQEETPEGPRKLLGW